MCWEIYFRCAKSPSSISFPSYLEKPGGPRRGEKRAGKGSSWLRIYCVTVGKRTKKDLWQTVPGIYSLLNCTNMLLIKISFILPFSSKITSQTHMTSWPQCEHFWEKQIYIGQHALSICDHEVILMVWLHVFLSHFSNSS